MLHGGGPRCVGHLGPVVRESRPASCRAPVDPPPFRWKVTAELTTRPTRQAARAPSRSVRPAWGSGRCGRFGRGRLGRRRGRGSAPGRPGVAPPGRCCRRRRSTLARCARTGRSSSRASGPPRRARARRSSLRPVAGRCR